MHRSVAVVLAAVLSLALAGTASAAVRSGGADDQREPDAASGGPRVGDIARADGAYDPASGGVVVSALFQDAAPVEYAFALYEGRAVRRGDDCEGRGDDPAFTGVVRDPAPGGSPYAVPLPSQGQVAGTSTPIAGQTYESDQGRRFTAFFEAAGLRDRNYRCVVIDARGTGFGTSPSPADRSVFFFEGFAPVPPDVTPDPEPEPRVRLTRRSAAVFATAVLARRHSRRSVRPNAGGRYFACGFDRLRGRRTAACGFRLKLSGRRAVIGSLGVQVVANQLRAVAVRQRKFSTQLRSCEVPSLGGSRIINRRLRAGGLLSCGQAVGVARRLQGRGGGRKRIAAGGRFGPAEVYRLDCRARRRGRTTSASCTNGLGDRLTYSSAVKPPPPKPKPTPPSSGGGDGGGGGCDPNYSPCVPAYPPDLDCDDTGPVTVIGPNDPHGLDADGDNSGCES